ncbi:Oxidoreductase [Mycena sanguinolenta]|uniref:Oxidoreductase n=1 Tax=Mycena sanguinolenta TaxID=230812 RepID=A0A8H6Z1M2_9AGAR|nr:Oxidoreductase [Mycena sanguinolenta]
MKLAPPRSRPPFPPPTSHFSNATWGLSAASRRSRGKSHLRRTGWIFFMCNAGIWTLPPALTDDGYELLFGTNHLAHALFIKLLLPTLLRTPDARVVLMTSMAFQNARGIPLDRMRDAQRGFIESNMRYPHSKLANLIYASELARRYPELTAVSVHPGVVTTDMVVKAPWFERMIIKVIQMMGETTNAPAEGAHTQLWAATVEKGKLVAGGYYVPGGVLGAHTKQSSDEKLAGELWSWTEKELEGYSA